MPSVVIPAHNEQRQIARCLRALLRDTPPGELEVVVVCNGCDDRTAEEARQFAPSVRVIELVEASKSTALNVGDAHASSFPRLYVDADSELNPGAVKALARALEGGALVAYPKVLPELAGASLGVKLYYRIWERLCYARGDLIGAGAYALSSEGRRRFDDFPALIADDFFVRRLFRRSEVALVETAHSIIRPPHSLEALVGVLTRVIGGNRECELRFDERFAHEGRRPSLLGVVGPRPALWLPALMYAWVLTRANLNAMRRARAGARVAWSQDKTTRGSA